MSIEARNFKQGGMDSDSTTDDIQSNDYVSAYNFRVTGTSESESGDGTNIEGTNLISSTLGGGLNKCIGAAGFPTLRKGYAFIYNSQGLWQLKEFDYDTLTETVLFTNKTDSGGISVFDLDPQYYINDIKLIQDRYLCFNDSYSTPHYIDLVRLKNGSYGSLISEDFSLIKGQPIKEPKAVYNNDSGRSVNLLKNRLFQFREQWGKLDNESTAWGTISKRVVPIDEPTPAKGTDVTVANNMIVSVDAGNNRTSKIRVAARYDLLDWFLIKDILRSTVVALPNTTVNVAQEIYEAYDPATNIYSFAFYNDGNYQNVNVLETDLPYDYVPNVAETMEVINGSILVLGGITEGYDRPVADVSISVNSYDPKINVDSVAPDPLRITSTTNDRIPNSHERSVSIYFAGLPKTGDKIIIQTRDIRDYASVNNLPVYTVPSTQNNNLTAVLASLAASIPNSWATSNQINFKTAPYYELSFARLELANAGTGASKSIHALKSNSSYQLALANYDANGKYFPIVTDERFVIKTPSYALTHGLTSQINWDLKNSKPPIGSVSYQWLLTLNNTHATDLYVNGAYSDAKSDADYLVFNISSLWKFNEVNSSSILNYDYSAGDRVTLMFTFSGTNTPIKWFDSPAIDVEVVGLDVEVDTSVTPNVSKYYLKVRKSASLNVADINGVGVLMEIYSPKKRVTVSDGVTTDNPQLFYEIGERFDVVNGEYSVKQGTIRDGDVYFKTRTYSGVLDPNIAFQFLVEDFNFSDFYQSNYYSIGRPRIYDDEQGKVKKGASIRYSDTFIQGSKVNGITRFYGERIYGEGAGETSSNYGSIKKLRVRDNYLICIQELKVGHIPLNMSIVEDQAEQRQYAISDKLLNYVRYLSGNFGIGNAKESYGESQNGTIYFADPNNSLPIRDGYDGLKVISGKMTKYFRRVLKQAKADGLKIIGYYDNFNDEFNLSIENRNGVLTNFVFNTTDWQLLDNYVINPADLVITSNSNGSTVLNGDGTATFTPTSGYTGNGGFTFSFLNGGATVTKNTCINITPGTTTIYPFYFIDLTDQEVNTIVYSNSVLIGGNNISVPISITGGEYQINSGAWVSVNGMVNAGDTVIVRQTTSSSNEVTTSAVLTVGAYSDSFDAKTQVAVDPAIMFYYTTTWGNNPYTEASFDIERNDVLIIQQTAQETSNDFNGVFVKGNKIKIIHTSLPANYPWETLSGSRLRIVKNSTTEIFNNIIGTQANPLQSFTVTTDSSFDRIDMYITGESTKTGVITKLLRPYIFLNSAGVFELDIVDNTNSATKLDVVPAVGGDNFKVNYISDGNTLTLNVQNTSGVGKGVYVEAGSGFTYTGTVGAASTLPITGIPKTGDIYFFDVANTGFIHRADFTRNNCGGGATGGTVPYVKGYVDSAAATADNANFDIEGQARANSLGTCTI